MMLRRVQSAMRASLDVTEGQTLRSTQALAIRALLSPRRVLGASEM